MQVQSGKTYVGVVEDNNDPQKLGRCKIRVFGFFDDFKIEDIPWANPWKDLAGNGFALPEKGKVVTVVFENADLNNPEFISSDHFNINLEKKLKGLSETDYLSMKSLIFDHKTQVYVNEGEGLKLDHKFNLFNIKESSIDVNLKDNFGKINLGTANSTQRAILGDNFLNWFDDFVMILMGSKGGPFLGNFGAPVVATPALLGSLQLYQQLKDPKFLSKNVYIVDNENVAKLDRIAEGQKGDAWQSTVKENNLTTKEPIPYTPTAGSTDTTFDQPTADKPIAPTQSTAANPVPPEQEQPKPLPTENPDIKILKELIRIKGYILYEEPEQVNIIAIRNQCILPGDKYTDLFSDKLYVMWKKADTSWDLKQYTFSTVPGLKFTITDSWLTEKNFKNIEPWSNSLSKNIFMKEYIKIVGEKNGDPRYKSGMPVLAPSQYKDTYFITQYKGLKAMGVVPGAKQLVWRDKDTVNIDSFNPTNYSSPEVIVSTELVDNSIRIHRGFPGGINVGNWSEGSQVFSSEANLNEFFDLCEIHSEKYGNAFTYTLATKNDWDEATKNVGADKASDSLAPIPVVATASTPPTGVNTQGSSNSTNQTNQQSLVDKNKSEDNDVLGDGSLIVSIKVTDVLSSGKISTDDIARIPQESIIFTIKSQSNPGSWQFFESSIDYTAPNDSGTGQKITSLNSSKAYLNLKSDFFDSDPSYSIGNYSIKIEVTLFNKNKQPGDANYQKKVTKKIEFSVEKGSSSSLSSDNQKRSFTIGVLNPNTPSLKRITGRINIDNYGNQKRVIGNLESLFPKNNTPEPGENLGPLVKNYSDSKSNDELAKDMIKTLEDELAKKYNAAIKLVILDVK